MFVTWYDYIRKWLAQLKADPQAAFDQVLCDTLDHELDLLDRGIILNCKSGLRPSELKTMLPTLMPPGHIVWALAISWPREEVATCFHTHFHLEPSRHTMMFTRFVNDFPNTYALYLPILARGLTRTVPEIITTEEGVSIEVIYYTWVARTVIAGDEKESVT